MVNDPRTGAFTGFIKSISVYIDKYYIELEPVGLGGYEFSIKRNEYHVIGKPGGYMVVNDGETIGEFKFIRRWTAGFSWVWDEFRVSIVTAICFLNWADPNRWELLGTNRGDLSDIWDSSRRFGVRWDLVGVEP